RQHFGTGSATERVCAQTCRLPVERNEGNRPADSQIRAALLPVSKYFQRRSGQLFEPLRSGIRRKP
ncbi:MAG: hypothetical protein LBL58_09445, partial [Tannerellaceae bacterium]|nr:hypothetical protein [Tannerellaceae bacterium]